MAVDYDNAVNIAFEMVSPWLNARNALV